MRLARKIGWEIWLPLLLVAVWWFVSAGTSSFYFPPLARIVEAFRADWLFANVSTMLVPSLERFAAGYAIAVAAGVLVGLLFGVFRVLEVAFTPVTEFFRSMPSVAVVPIMILLFGLDTEMKVATIAFVGFFPVLLNTVDGVRALNPQLRDLATSYHIRFLDRIRFMYLPVAAPQVFAGARIALALSIMAMAVSEMVGTPGGIGFFVLDSQRSFRIPSMWSGIIALGITGYVLNKLFLLVENRVLSWHRGMTAQSR
ncbi:ABC transporter permease [Actinomadura sp. LOL_016]|uniref:ABC transporter permease n=1 Tax=unclassified Actinomadura TaxID=2626254 RepID=UPI003A7FCF86